MVQPQVWESVLLRFCLAFLCILSAVRTKENTLAQKYPCSVPVLSVKNEDDPQSFWSQKKVKWCFWGLLVFIEMPRFSLGRQSSLWLLSFPALSFFPCAITKHTQVWIPLLPPSFNNLAEPGANLHCIWFYMETRAVSRSSVVLPVFRFAWDTPSSYPDCSESLAFFSKDFVLWNMEGHLLRQYRMIKDKVKLFYGRWGSGLMPSGKREIWSSTIQTKGSVGMVPLFVLSLGYFPPK